MPAWTGQYANNETIIYEELSKLGYSKSAICGILANVEKESGFNPRASGDGGDSLGLFQWNKTRKDRLIRFCNSVNYDPYSVQGQCSYFDFEMYTYYTQMRRDFKELSDTAQSAYDAGYRFCVEFERPANSNMLGVERGNIAKDKYWKYYNGGESTGDSNSYAGYDTPAWSGGDSSSSEYVLEVDFDALTSNDIYQSAVVSNLSAVQSVGYDFGYLIDVTHGGVFKFYIPEFTEQAGANWGTIKIPGRSVDIQDYESTNSRNISISLELYAGVGLYSSNTGDAVGTLHSDVNFVKSLEYPDYDTSVAQPPSTVHLILGSSVNILGVVSSVSIEHLKPLDSQNRAMYVKLSFTVTQIAVNPPSYRDIRTNQYSIAGTDNISSLQVGGGIDSNALNYQG